MPVERSLQAESLNHAMPCANPHQSSLLARHRHHPIHGFSQLPIIPGFSKPPRHPIFHRFTCPTHPGSYLWQFASSRLQNPHRKPLPSRSQNESVRRLHPAFNVGHKARKSNPTSQPQSLHQHFQFLPLCPAARNHQAGPARYLAESPQKRRIILHRLKPPRRYPCTALATGVAPARRFPVAAISRAFSTANPASR